MPLAAEILPVTSERWGDLERLFERTLGPRGRQPIPAACWCMAWRATPEDFRRGWGSGATRGQGNKAALRAVVDDGRVPGLLAYMDGEPIGWCSVAPREEFVRLESSRALPRLDDQPVWSVVCFYVDPSAQHQGLGMTLLQSAVDYARSRGARIVEGYASKPGDRDPFTGFESMFAAAGFVQVRPGGRRST